VKKKLKSVVEDISCREGRIFAIFIQLLIVISIVTFSAETIPSMDPNTLKILNWIETFCIVVFTIEYLLRIYLADSKVKFIFSFFGIIDFLAILPFYLAIGVDLLSIRALRLLRLFRLFKLVRYNNAIKKFITALKMAKEELILFFFITIILLYLSAVGIYYFESDAQPESFGSIFDSLWWAVATLTTVGYGDVYPVTIGGKIFTFFILLIGLSIIAIPAGIIASALSNSVKKDQ
jgi:voltage-gated potassium channel